MARGKIKGLRKFVKQLTTFVDPQTIHNEMKNSQHSRRIVESIVGTAKAAIGPGGARYLFYSPAYKKRLLKLGKLGKDVLVGANREGNDPGMMLYTGSQRKGGTYGRFTFNVKPKGRASIGWKGKDGNQDIYGKVHQGTAFGGQDHVRRKPPPRPWMHLQNPQTEQVVRSAYKQAFEQVIAKFNAGTLPRG